jgi:hypothetical protein
MIYIAESVCDQKCLPMIKGPGKLTPIQATYKDGDKVELVCGEDFVPGSHNHSTCMDGKFYPYQLECIKNRKSKTYVHFSELNYIMRPW